MNNKLLNQEEADLIINSLRKDEQESGFEFYVAPSGVYELVHSETGDSVTGKANWVKILEFIREDGE